MILLRLGARSAAPQAIAVLGTGLIGSAVLDACQRNRPLNACRLPLSWSDPVARQRDLTEIEQALLGELAGEERPEVAVLWAAGTAGFSAAEAETAGELESFRDVLATCRRLTTRRRALRVAFHLVSSAGGLHEGQRLVGPQTEPAPRHPYGRLKLAQEQALLEHAGELAPRIYRLSSVFGHVAPGRRRGLIPTLIADGHRQRVSFVTGRPDTLRDFIWAPDVGRFLARALMRPAFSSEPTVATLAAAKASSLHEVQRLIETALRRKLRLSYRPSETGEANITFAPTVLPPGWRNGDLYTNLCQVRDRILGRGTGRRALPG